MSAATAPAAGHGRSRAASPAGGARRVAAWAQTETLPLRAFVYSRLIVLLAGAGGVLTVAKHDHVAAASALRRLGPVGYALAGSVDRFDSGYYLDIANHGYGSLASGKLAFYPLYPLLLKAVAVLSRSPVIAGVAISAGSFLVALVLLHRLTELELGRRAADATVLLLAFSPLSFFFTAVYTESLFLMLAVATVLAARRGRWELACTLGVLATLTRPTGLLLAVALVVMRVRARGRPDRRLAWVLALPAALLGYMTLLAAGGYPWLGVFAAEAKWQRVTTGPIGGLAAGAWAAIRGAGRIAGGTPFYHPTLRGPLTASGESILLLAVLAIACLALVSCLRRLPLEYGAFAGAVLLICLSSPDAGQPLWSLDRYALTIFPLWMAAGAWLAKRRLVVPAVTIGSLLLAFYTVEFSSWAFVG